MTYAKKILPLVSMLSMLSMFQIASTGCKRHDKATTAETAKVSIKVVDDSLSNGNLHAGAYSGTTESGETTVVSFSVPGTITATYADVGQQVVKGQRLAAIKSGNLRDADNMAQAELAEARDAYARMKKLHDANALPDIKWVEVQQKLKQAENAASIARRGVGDAVIYAPMTGMISEKMADSGQTVVPSQPVYSIVNLNKMQIAISVPEEDIDLFRQGMTADVGFDNIDCATLRGILRQKGVNADPLTRAYKVKFDIPNPDNRILPGMIGNVAIGKTAAKCDGENIRNARYELPSQAVLLDSDNRRFVWIVSKGKAERRFVEADELSADGVYVTKGLTPGDSVIVAGMQKVSSGVGVTTK